MLCETLCARVAARQRVKWSSNASVGWISKAVCDECRKSRVEILPGHIATDHLHVMGSILPQVTISRLVPWVIVLVALSA